LLNQIVGCSSCVEFVVEGIKELYYLSSRDLRRGERRLVRLGDGGRYSLETRKESLKLQLTERSMQDRERGDESLSLDQRRKKSNRGKKERMGKKCSEGGVGVE
jgi:hypothetical protein